MAKKKKEVKPLTEQERQQQIKEINAVFPPPKAQ